MGSEITFYACDERRLERALDDGNRAEIARRDDHPGVFWLLHFRMSDWVSITEDAGGGNSHDVPYLLCKKNRAICQFEAGLTTFRREFPQTNLDFEDEVGKYNAVENFGGYVRFLNYGSVLMDIYFGWYPWNDLIWKIALLGIEYPAIKVEYSAEMVEKIGVEMCRQLGITAGTVVTWQGALRRLCVPPPNADEERWRRYCDEESSDLIGEAGNWYSASDILGVAQHYEY